MPVPGPRPLERWLVTLLLVLCLGLVVALAMQRLRVETKARTVELAFPESRLLDAAKADPTAPQALQGAGVTTLVRVPYTLNDMLRYGLAEAWHPEPNLIEIRLADSALTSNAIIYLTGQFGMSALQIRLRENQFICDVTLPGPTDKIEPDRFILEIPVGPMPGGFRRGLALPAGDWGLTRDLNQFTQSIYSLQPEVVIPIWKGGMNAAYFFRSYFNTPWLRKPGVAIPEFSLPPPARRIARGQTRYQLFRSHYLSPREVGARPLPELRRRILRAVAERGVNLVYFDPPRNWPFASSLEFLRKLKEELTRRGFQPGAAQPPAHTRAGYLAMNVIYWGVGALFFLLLWKAALWAVGYTGQDQGVDRVLTIHLRPLYFRWAAISIPLALLILHWEGSPAWGGKIAALLIAIIVPLLTLSQLPLNPEPEGRLWRVLNQSLQEFSVMTAVNLAAGLTIAGLLYHPAFVQRFDVFLGVKVAYLLPLLLAGIYLFPGITDGEWWKQRFNREKRWWTWGTLGLLAALLAVLIIRTGNTTWFPVTALEMSCRDGLESFFGVRPRWKEFLIGHPCLLLGLAGRRLAGRPDRVWPRILILIGMIGQVSIINSFCHLHTPLVITLLRTFHGLWLGVLLGLAILWSWQHWARRRQSA